MKATNYVKNKYSSKVEANNSTAEKNKEKSKNGLIIDGMFLCNSIHGKISEIYNGNGQLIYKGGMAFGFKFGWGEEYYINGNLMNKGFYKKDKLHGYWCQSYSINGKIMFEGECKDGMRNGVGKIFHLRTGNLRYFGDFKDDMFETKISNLYWENGTIETRCSFEKGNKLGSFFEYNTNGKVKFRGKYDENGFSTDFVVMYRKNGLIKYVGKIKDFDYFEGKVYDKKGALNKVIEPCNKKNELEKVQVEKNSNLIEQEETNLENLDIKLKAEIQQISIQSSGKNSARSNNSNTLIEKSSDISPNHGVNHMSENSDKDLEMNIEGLRGRKIKMHKFGRINKTNNETDAVLRSLKEMSTTYVSETQK